MTQDEPIELTETLSTPLGTASIRVRFELDPPTSRCTVFGHNSEGDVLSVEVNGSGVYDLPFYSPHIMIRWGRDLETLATKVLRHSLPGERAVH